jgi:hypothetical protein
VRSGRPACPCSRAPVGGGQRSILHSRHFSRLRYREKCAAFAPLVTNAADRTATRHSSSTPRPAIPTLRGRSGGSEADVRAARNGHWQHGIKSATLAPDFARKAAHFPNDATGRKGRRYQDTNSNGRPGVFRILGDSSCRPHGPTWRAIAKSVDPAWRHAGAVL